MMNLQGSCLCGAVQYQINGKCSDMLNCHCSLCRKSHGSAFATFTSVHRDDLEFTAGLDHQCGSLMPSLWGEIWNVPAGCINYDPNIQAKGHIFVGEKASWFDICDEIPQFDTRPQSPPGS